LIVIIEQLHSYNLLANFDFLQLIINRESAPGTRLTGLEISSNMIEVAEKNAREYNLGQGLIILKVMHKKCH